jgi:hypothetical protein
MRQINWDEPLSDEDRTWAEQRPDMPAGNGMTVGQRLALMDEGKTSAQSRGERIEELRAVIADANNEIERLMREQAEEDNVNSAVVGDPASGLVRDNTEVNGQRPEGADEPRETYSNEKVWTKAKLSEEINNRNNERVEQGLEPLSTHGTRAELVERLMKDDEEIEG